MFFEINIKLNAFNHSLSISVQLDWLYSCTTTRVFWIEQIQAVWGICFWKRNCTLFFVNLIKTLPLIAVYIIFSLFCNWTGFDFKIRTGFDFKINTIDERGMMHDFVQGKNCFVRTQFCKKLVDKTNDILWKVQGPKKRSLRNELKNRLRNIIAS